MKRGKVLMTVLVVLAVLFASCSNGMSKDDASGAASGEKVMVSLGVDVEGAVSQKAISSNTDLNGMTYWYKAAPQWDQDRPIHGGTNGQFVMIPNYSARVNIGYFTAGEWKFWAEVRKGSDVIYSSPVAGTDYTIYTGHAAPEITVTPDGTGKGTITFSVNVPATGGATPAHEELQVYVNGSRAGVTVERSGYDDSLATYSGFKSNLTPGPYTVTFKYLDEDGTVTEGAAQAVTVFAGQTSEITGIIDAGKWHPSTITINAPGITNLNLTPTSGHRTPFDSSSYDFTVSATSAHEIEYQWFINGTDQGDPDPDADTFEFSSNDCGMYNITCTATDKTDKVTASKTVYVEVGYMVTIADGITNGTVDYGVNSSNTAVFADGDIVSMSVTPAPNYTVDTLDPAGKYDAASHTATFVMPDEDTEFSVTFALKPYTVAIANGILNGTVTDVSSEAKHEKGDIINLTIAPTSGYHLAKLTVNGKSIMYGYDSGEGTASFAMPNENATVSATFEADAP